MGERESSADRVRRRIVRVDRCRRGAWVRDSSEIRCRFEWGGAPRIGWRSRRDPAEIATPAIAVQVRARRGAPSDDGVVSALLLGAILLDTANLQPQRKAQAAWEVDTARSLGTTALGPHGPLGLPTWPDGGADAWFDELIGAKSDVEMLLQFPLEDLLRQDYKGEEVRIGAVGVASVVVPSAMLLRTHGEAGLARAMAAFAASRKLRLLLLMCCDFKRGERQVGASPDALRGLARSSLSDGALLAADHTRAVDRARRRQLVAQCGRAAPSRWRHRPRTDAGGRRGGRVLGRVGAAQLRSLAQGGAAAAARARAAVMRRCRAPARPTRSASASHQYRISC